VADLHALGRRSALIGGLAVSVRTLKLLARDDRTRPQDRVDLAALLRQADGAALDEVRSALQLITQRGFHRGRNLAAALDTARQELGA
jgi:hypothetical protein